MWLYPCSLDFTKPEKALVIIRKEPESETSLESWEQHYFAGQVEAEAESSGQEFYCFSAIAFFLGLIVLNWQSWKHGRSFMV